jgi:Fe-S cluster biogenesis protein NfuA
MKKLTPEERIERILTKVRPYVEMHGGDVRLTKVEGDTATCKIYGACVGCGLADLTYNKMVGGIIREEVPEIKNVVFEN